MALHRLVVIRHAKSDYPLGVEDHDRPLSDRGRRDAPEIGRWLASSIRLTAGERVCVAVSSSLRTQQTWELITSTLGDAWAGSAVETDPRIYEASPSTLRQVVQERDWSDTVVVVGHNPGLLQLVTELGRPGEVRSDAIAKFPTSAIAVLELSGPDEQALREVGSFDVSAFACPRG